VTVDKTRKKAHFLNPDTPMTPANSDVTERAIEQDQHLPADCKDVGTVLSRVGDKWSVLVIMALSDQARRFNELKRTVGGISQRMLTLTLRGLERDGLVTRTIYPTIPPRVDYELTDLGRSLREPVINLGQWAFTHMREIKRAREEFDKANTGS